MDLQTQTLLGTIQEARRTFYLINNAPAGDERRAVVQSYLDKQAQDYRDYERRGITEVQLAIIARVALVAAMAGQAWKWTRPDPVTGQHNREYADMLWGWLRVYASGTGAMGVAGEDSQAEKEAA